MFLPSAEILIYHFSLISMRKASSKVAPALKMNLELLDIVVSRLAQSGWGNSLAVSETFGRERKNRHSSRFNQRRIATSWFDGDISVFNSWWDQNPAVSGLNEMFCANKDFFFSQRHFYSKRISSTTAYAYPVSIDKIVGPVRTTLASSLHLAIGVSGGRLLGHILVASYIQYYVWIVIYELELTREVQLEKN